jgi:glucose-1-phosphate thymidylyltransferase
MKVIIPVAGAGAKLRPHTYTQPKPLIPLAGKTILSFILDQFIELGHREFIFIIGYLGEKIQDYVHAKYPDIQAIFIQQNERSGTGHAVYLAKNYIGKDEEIMVVFGDTICDYPLETVIKSDISLIGLKKVEDPREFGVAELHADGTVKHVVEKPLIPKSNLALVGIYKINESAQLFELIEKNMEKSEHHEEYHLTTAIESLAQEGVKIGSFFVENWFDCGKKETLIETNAILLEKVEFASEEIPFFDNTIIIHPVSIGEGCEIENSIIGPHVTIGEKAIIKSSMVRDSIIGSYSVLEKVVLHSSLIGSDAFVCGASQSLNIGDNTEINLSK